MVKKIVINKGKKPIKKKPTGRTGKKKKAAAPKSIALEPEKIPAEEPEAEIEVEEAPPPPPSKKLLRKKKQNKPAKPEPAVEAEPEEKEEVVEDAVFRFYCIRCGQKLKVRTSSAGTQKPCPSCDYDITVPEPFE